jgi:ubiquinone/menaquinone biosynthesis C-methylase UbiE
MSRQFARKLAKDFIEKGDPLGWFEALYAGGDASKIPWADQKVNPNFEAWLQQRQLQGRGKKALKVGCGLGDDAERLAELGFGVTAFDISPTAIDWCRRRFPQSKVRYLVQDLFQTPEEWKGAFDFVLESYTLQVLLPDLRKAAIQSISRFVAPEGMLLVIARGRKPEEPKGEMPWPLVREELREFEAHGLQEVNFEEYVDKEDPPVRRFRVEYRRR